LRNGCPLKETEIFLDLASTEIEQPQGRSGKNRDVTGLRKDSYIEIAVENKIKIRRFEYIIIILKATYGFKSYSIKW